MKRRSDNLFKGAKRGAFTLLETIISLVLMAIVLNLLQWGTHLANQHHQHAIDQELAWQIILQQIEDPNRYLRVTRIDEDSLNFQDRDGRVISMFVSKNVLRLAVNKKGYQPLLYGVRSISNTQVGKRAQVTVTMLNGKQFTNQLLLPLSLTQKGK